MQISNQYWKSGNYLEISQNIILIAAIVLCFMQLPKVVLTDEKYWKLCILTLFGHKKLWKWIVFCKNGTRKMNKIQKNYLQKEMIWSDVKKQL